MVVTCVLRFQGRKKEKKKEEPCQGPSIDDGFKSLMMVLIRLCHFLEAKEDMNRELEMNKSAIYFEYYSNNCLLCPPNPPDMIVF